MVFQGNYSGLLTACGSSQEVFVLRAVPPLAAQPAAQKDASRRRRRGIRHLSSYFPRKVLTHV